jgi:hypothetical protein
MLDEITEKLLKSTTALYMPKLEELAKSEPTGNRKGQSAHLTRRG